jgi:hypothetical protein
MRGKEQRYVSIFKRKSSGHYQISIVAPPEVRKIFYPLQSPMRSSLRKQFPIS